MDIEVKISKTELDKLRLQSFKLQCLEAGGVEDWYGYGTALREFNAIEKRKVILSNFMEELHQVIAEGELTYPAGFGCGHQLDFDENFVIKLVDNVIRDIKELENE
jgi:hypothetical protein